MIERKWMIIVIGILFWSLTTAGCSPTRVSNESEQKKGNEQEVTLTVSSYFTGNSPLYSAIIKPWMERVTELTEGNVQFEYFPDNRLGSSEELLDLTQSGVIDISVFPVNYAPFDVMPLSNMLAGLPNLSETSHQGTMAFHELIQENKYLLETDYLKNGVRPILIHVSPSYGLWTTGKEIRVPEDLNGLIVRTPGGVSNELYEYIGATPLTVPLSDTPEVLDKELIDAISLYSLGLKNANLDDVLRYGVFPNMGTVIQGVIINEDKWNSLSEETQTAMIKAGDEIMEAAGKTYFEETKQFNNDFVKKGKNVAQLTDNELKQWETISYQFTNSWLHEHKNDGFPYHEVLSQYKEKLAKYK
jgi:TRAP-type transport system periplasmic protein